jgi:hypothetical protein
VLDRHASSVLESTADMAEPISPPPLTSLESGRLLAHLGNGLVGLRVGRIPLDDGLAIVNGFWGDHPKDDIPTFAPAPYPLAGDVVVAGVRASERRRRSGSSRKRVTSRPAS